MNKNLRINTRLKSGVIIAVLIIASISGCTSAQKRADTQSSDKSATREAVKENENSSSIDFEYVLSRSHYRLTFHSIAGVVKAENSVDKQVIAKTTVKPSRYQEYLDKTLTFVKDTRSKEKEEAQALDTKSDACRAPFHITIHIKEETYAAKGCRNRDKGALSKLVQEGEFLLYSKL